MMSAHVRAAAWVAADRAATRTGVQLRTIPYGRTAALAAWR
jgi:hypothetical protein